MVLSPKNQSRQIGSESGRATTSRSPNQHSRTVQGQTHSHVTQGGNAHSHVTHGGNAHSHVTHGGHVQSHVAHGGNAHSHVTQGGYTQSHVTHGAQSYITHGGHAQSHVTHGGHVQSHVTHGGRRSYIQDTNTGSEHVTNIHTRNSFRDSVSPRRSEIARTSHRGDRRVVSEMAHPERSKVLNVIEGQGRVVDEHVVESRIIREYENVGEGVVISRGNIPKKEPVHSLTNIQHEVPRVVEKIIEKVIPIIKENPVPREHYVDKHYDVILEKPIERIIEKEVITEKRVEIPMRRIVEIPVEKIIEVPYERIVEEPVENIVYVDRITEKVQHVPFEKVYENIVYEDRVQQIDHDQLAHLNYEHCLPEIVNTVHTEHIIERPVYRENIINQHIEIPVEKIIEVEKERIIEVQCDNIIENRYQIDNIIEKVVDVPVEHVKTVQIEQVIEVPEYIDNPVPNPIAIEKIRENVVKVSLFLLNNILDSSAKLC